ncbi:MAG: ribosome recycling factor [Patescibacteria group bacterium]|jgi:ribosome recycling factor
MSDILTSLVDDFEEVIEFLHLELKTLRTGRATPALVENIQVEAYGARTPIVGLASISTPDARTIVIDPWDKNLLKDIERGIQEAKTGLNPVIQGKIIRISMPALTEESRRELAKIMSDKLEQARIGIRGVRENAKAEIIRKEKDKEIPEDDKYRMLEQLEKMVAGFNDKIKSAGEEKEKDIMTI